MSSTLYSLRTDGDQFRITKITDGDIESSYLCTETECECPAGHRPSCRHRQMLPQMLAHGLCNTHWFFDFDSGGRIVDFNGTDKRLLDQLAAAAPAPVPAKEEIWLTFEVPVDLAEEVVLIEPQRKPWRRL